jgi:ketol-acid reductoisomerase
MAAQILETISKDEMERMIYEDQLIYEADLIAMEHYVVRTAEERGEKRGKKGGKKEVKKEMKKEVKKRVKKGKLCK